MIDKLAKTKTLLIYVEVDSLKRNIELDEQQKEFFELVNSTDVDVVEQNFNKQKVPETKNFINKGTLEKIKNKVIESQAELAIVNQELSASQARNLELTLKIRVIDKTELIMDIFAQRASSHVGKLQVELAQLNHLSTRLIRGWTHLERQKGGIGLRGPGETQLETDRRLIGNRIKNLKKRLDKAHNQKKLNSYARKKSMNKSVALVGYTNAGKTTLFNKLTNSKQFAENKLFATLDSVTRRNIDPEIGPILFSDTVGFISDLPTQLIESFKATLDELKSADLLLHIVDASDNDYQQKLLEVDKILKDLGLENIPTIIVKNKCDLLRKHSSSLFNPKKEILISAEKNIGIDKLRENINKKLYNGIYSGWISLESSMGKIRSKLFGMGCIKDEKISSCGNIYVYLQIGKDDLNNFLKINGFNLCQENDIILEKLGT
ncbi:GTPase HflX [SAR86 cluster bacterium]|nr:GTPase HflX [SAR86 cluster bacterium]